ncbi:MAG: type II/IV secretion system protein [Armatimonadetes bacterium]|nr:type II/IV secretion system protein [Armatimonadota bacterium]
MLHVVDHRTVDEGRACMARLKTLGGLPPADFQRPADGRIPLRLEGRDYDLRVSYAPGLHGGRLCARILSRGDALPAWDAVGLLPAEDAALRRMIRMPHGLIVVCGPTGCGKTTLLYMLMQQIASPEINCLSVEDPVELAMDWVAQSRVNVAAGQTFASLVRTFMRQDPDAILVGEIRDLETLQITCQAALTGHLVMTTLHTQHAIGAVRRMVDLGLEPFLLANVLVGIVGMRLVRCICPHCRAEVEPSSTAAMHFGLEPGSYAATAGQGCEHCHGTGYRGRRGLYEVIEVSKALSQAIAERAMRLRELAFSGELPDFRGHAAQLIREGVTTPEECARVLDQAW